jgi:hypothetical protein
MTLLKLDYDGALPEGWINRLGFVARENGVRIRWTRIDKTRHGWHVTAQLSHEVMPLQIVLMQALCGSDYRRETFNGVRALTVETEEIPEFWSERFNQLFTEHHRNVIL